MYLTRVIALSIIAAAISAVSAPAQNLRNAAPPAEFPPSSYTGKQYVDSRGCIYIRAGIDGNVTWVPRVGRDRKQVCGFNPTTVAGATTAPAPAAKPVEITVPAAAQQTRPLPPAVANPAARPAPAPTPRVATVPAAPQAAPVIVRRPAPAPAPVRKPAVTAPRPAQVIAPRRAPAATGGPCSNASPFSQRYINRAPDVRCGPQAEPPVTYGRGWDRQSALSPRGTATMPYVSPQTRAVPRHVYDNRRNTRSVSVPEGYRPIWSDDRLNPYRAERRLTPAQLRAGSAPPAGYRAVARADDRLNPNRGPRSAAGNAQADQIWTRTVPRTLVPLPTDRQIVTVPREVAKSPAEAERKTLIRLSTRSAPVKASAPRRYVRVATFGSEAQARQAAQAMARGGLPMRLGTVQRGGATQRVVLAGPFTSAAQAQDALQRVHAAGYSGATLNN